MAKKQSNVNKSEEIRQVLKANPDLKTKEVVETLAKQGIEVSDDLVYFVKGQIQGRKGKKKKASTEGAKVTEKGGGMNKSEEIRQVLKANPGIKASEVVSSLAKKGIEVSENLVYLVKGKMKGRQHRKEKVRKMVAQVASATGTVASSDAVSIILKVRSLASEVGGMDKLKALVEALS